MDKNIVIPAGTGTVSINQNPSSNPILNGSISLNRQTTLTSGGSLANAFSSSMTLTGTISGSGSFNWFNGNFNLWGNNTFTGGLFMGSALSSVPNRTFLGLGTDTALGTGTVSVNDPSFYPGTFRADNGARTLANNIAFITNTTSTPQQVLSFAGVNDLTWTGQVDLGGGALPGSIAGSRGFEVTNCGVTTFAGVISGTTTSTLTKTGGGKLVMSGVNTFQGNVTVAAGTLLVNGNNTGAGSYTINAAGFWAAPA